MYVVKRQGKRWGVYFEGKLIEGGFFDREAAQECCDAYNAAANFNLNFGHGDVVQPA